MNSLGKTSSIHANGSMEIPKRKHYWNFSIHKVCFTFSTWSYAWKVRLNKNIPFKVILFRDVGRHGVDENRISLYVLVWAFMSVYSLSLCLSPSLCFLGSYKFYVSGKLNENPELTQILRKSSGLLKTLRQSITEAMGQINASHCIGVRKLRKGIKLDCVRKTFFQGSIERDIYQERNSVSQLKITESHTVCWPLEVCLRIGHSPCHRITYTDP